MNIPGIVPTALATANTPSVVTADACNQQSPMAFGIVLDAAGQADTSPADAGQAPAAGNNDADDNSGVLDSVAASILLLFSGFEFPANTISPAMESTVNDMRKDGTMPAADSSPVAAGSVADAIVQTAVSKQYNIIASSSPEFVGGRAAGPVGHVAKPYADALAADAPVDAVSSDALASIAALISTGNTAPLDAAIPATPPDTDKAVTANAVVSERNSNVLTGAMPSGWHIVSKEESVPDTELSNPVNAAEAGTLRTGNPAAITGIDVRSIKVSSGVAEAVGSADMRHKAVPNNNVSEVSQMDAEAVATPGTEMIMSAGMPAEINETVGRLDLSAKPKNETGKDSSAQGNLTAINAYNMVRSMDSASGVSEPAESQNVRTSIVEQLQEPVTRAITRGADHIRLRLQPEGLGDLRVNIRIADGDVRLEIITDKILSRQILEQGLPELQSLMRDDGISLKSVRVEYGGGDDRETPRRRDEHPPYRQGHGKRRENFAGYFA